MRRIIAGSLALLIWNAALAEASQTEWLTVDEWKRKSRTLAGRGEMPSAVRCKDAGTAGLNRQSGLLKFRIAKNPDRRRWAWAFGSRYGATKRRLERCGYQLVSSYSYRRQSGLVIRCGVWHRPG